MAGRIALDLKQFKHLKSDEKSHTLQHRDGHTLTLATKALHPDNQKQLSALAEAATSSKKSTDKSEDTQDKQVRGMADGGDVQDAQPESAIGKQIQRDEMMRAPDPMRGIDPNAQMPTGPKTQDASKQQIFDQAQSVVGPELTREQRLEAMQITPAEMQEYMDKASGMVGGGLSKVGGVIPKAAMQNVGKVIQPGVQNVMGAIGRAGENVFGKAAAKPLSEGGKKYMEMLSQRKAGGGEVREYAEGTTDVEAAPQVPSALSPSAPNDPIGDITKVPTEVVQPTEGSAQQDVQIRNRNLMDIYNRIQPIAEPGYNFEKGEPPAKGIDARMWQRAHEILGSENEDAQAEVERQAKNRSTQASIMQELGKTPPPGPTIPSTQMTPPTEAPPGQVVGQQIAPQAQGQGQQQPQAPGQHIPGMQESANKYFTSQQAGIQGLAGAQQAEAIAKQQAYESQQTALADAANDFKTRYQALDAERKAHIDDIKNGYIDPDKYWTGDKQGNGSHSRLMAGIGMLIAGFNPTSNPNAAIDFVNKQVTNSIDAQKANLSQKQNLLSANLQQFHNLKDAQDMTRIMMNDSVANKINLAAAKVGTQTAKAQAQLAMSQLYRQNYDLQMQMGMRSVMMNPSQDPMTAAQQATLLRANGQSDMANNIESKIVPNVGVAKIPVSAETRGQITAMKVLDDKGKDLLGFIKQNAGTMNPSKRAVVQQKVEEMKNFYNDSIKGGALTEGRLAWYDEQFKKTPTDIIPRLMGNTARLQEMIESNHARYNTLIGQHGLPQAAATPMAPQYQEGQTGKDTKGNPIVFSNGHWRRK